MSDLTDFILARIAEDEIRDARWRWGRNSGEVNGVLFLTDGTVEIDWYDRPCQVVSLEEFDELARPLITARVLAECEAKRRIVGLHEADAGVSFYALMMLALPYAAHPDYRDEWRP